MIWLEYEIKKEGTRLKNDFNIRLERNFFKYNEMYDSIYKNNELENEMTLDMSYFWYSDIVGFNAESVILFSNYIDKRNACHTFKETQVSIHCFVEPVPVFPFKLIRLLDGISISILANLFFLAHLCNVLLCNGNVEISCANVNVEHLFLLHPNQIGRASCRERVLMPV